MSSEGVTNWRKNTKRRMVEAMGGNCVICNYDRCVSAMDFHHLNSTEKEFSLSNIVANPRSWRAIVQELRKCILLCNRCHKEVHAGIAVLPDNCARFNEAYADYREIERLGRQTPCPICRTPMRKTNRTCSPACFSKIREKVLWDNFDLVEMARTMSNVAIAKLLGVSDVTISKKLKMARAAGIEPASFSVNSRTRSP